MSDSVAAQVSRGEIAAAVKEAIVYVKDLDVSPESIPEDVPIFRHDSDERETLDLDSLDALELGILFEEKYGLGVGSELEPTENTTLGEVIDFLVVYLAREAATTNGPA